MKKFLMLALCVLFTLPSFAQKDGVAWEHGTLAEALNKAKRTNKRFSSSFLQGIWMISFIFL